MFGNYKQAEENYRSLLKKVKNVHHDLRKTQEKIDDTKAVLIEKIDDNHQQLFNGLQLSLSVEREQLSTQIIAHLNDESTGLQFQIAGLIQQTLETLAASHEDVLAHLEMLNNKAPSVKAKWQLGLPFLFSIEGEKDVTNEVSKLLQAIDEYLPKGIIT